MSNNTASFSIKYSGSALDSGRMDVKDLAPALLSIGELFEAVNLVLYRGAEKIDVQVSTTKNGSFEVGLELINHSWDALALLADNKHAQGATVLLALLGSVYGAGKGVLWLIQKSRGKKPKEVKHLDNGNVKLTFEHTTITIPLQTLYLYQDVSVRESATKVIYDPLLKDGITQISLKDEKDEFIVAQKERDFFQKPLSPDETLLEDSRTSAFSIVSLAFKEENKWRLFDGNSIINVFIEDKSFLSKVDKNLISFSKNDVLVCEVKYTQIKTSEGLKTNYVVTKVLEHRPSAKQLPLLEVEE